MIFKEIEIKKAKYQRTVADGGEKTLPISFYSNEDGGWCLLLSTSNAYCYSGIFLAPSSSKLIPLFSLLLSIGFLLSSRKCLPNLFFAASQFFWSCVLPATNVSNGLKNVLLSKIDDLLLPFCFSALLLSSRKMPIQLLFTDLLHFFFFFFSRCVFTGTPS